MNIQIISGTIRIPDLNQFLVKLSNFAIAYNITIQAMNADLLSGLKHILFAVEKAIRSFESGCNTANNLGMEIMLYTSGRRQIERALDLGVRPGENNAAIVLVGENGTGEAANKIKNLFFSTSPRTSWKLWVKTRYLNLSWKGLRWLM